MAATHEDHITGIVCHYAWSGIIQGAKPGDRGSYNEYQPASNGGMVRIANGDGITDLWFGGPGKNPDVEVNVGTFYNSATKLMSSFCYGTSVTVAIKHVPGNSFPNILSVA